MSETWVPVPGFSNYYEASDLGRIRSSTRHCKGRALRGSKNTSGHIQVHLVGDRLYLVHRLVLLAFTGPCPDGMEICHNDGDHANNALQNLRYDTRSANQFDRVRHGTHHNAVKTHCPQGHPLSGENLYSQPGNRRVCRTCKRRNRAARRAA